MPGELSWIDAGHQARLAEEGTDAFRMADGREIWIERFGPAVLVSTMRDFDTRQIVAEILLRCEGGPHGMPAAIYQRTLVKGPGKDDKPALLHGAIEGGLCTARERDLRFEVDFSAGYSVGLFPDQRSNRTWLRGLRPESVLNTFAFTCAFSVAAAAAGSRTISVDLARAALARGRRNFELNSIPLEGQRFIADDTFDVLPRLARRGERFDAIILDPPTFSRGRSGRVFRAQEQMAELLRLALPCANRGAVVLLSTNCSSLSSAGLAALAVPALPSGARVEQVPPEPDYPGRSGASMVRIRLP